MIYEYIVPAMIGPSSTQRGAPLAVRAVHKADLTEASRYQKYDLATTDATDGHTLKMVQTTAANVTGLLLAGHDWDMKYAHIDQRDNTKSILSELINDKIHPEDTFIATFQGDTANAGNHVATAANIVAINRGTAFNLVYNSTQGVMTIRSATTSPAIRTLGVHKGEEGNSNIIVAFRFLPERLA